MSIKNTLTKPEDYAGTGRVCLLTDNVQSIICSAIAAGNYMITACRAAGISDDTFRQWLANGKAEEEAGETSGRFSAFVGAVKKAEAEAELKRVARIDIAGEGGQVSKRRITTFKDGTQTVEESFSVGQWLADMTHLERRHPERWARPAPVNQQIGGNTYNINIEKAIIDAAGKFDAVMSRLAERTAQPLAVPSNEEVGLGKVDAESGG